jgi:hypothetical protein
LDGSGGGKITENRKVFVRFADDDGGLKEFLGFNHKL